MVEEEFRSFLNGVLCEFGNGVLVFCYIFGDFCFFLLLWFVIFYGLNEEEEDGFEFNNVVCVVLCVVEIVFVKV